MLSPVLGQRGATGGGLWRIGILWGRALDLGERAEQAIGQRQRLDPFQESKAGFISTSHRTIFSFVEAVQAAELPRNRRYFSEQ